MKPRIAIVTGTLQLGGSTSFVFNLASELVKRQLPCLVVSGEADNPMASDFARNHVEVVCWDERREIFEDRIERTLQRLREFKPGIVIANLAPFEFEILRYLPKGIFKIAMLHSHDPNVYPTVEKYADWIDMLVGVSAVIVKKLAGMRAFNRLPKHHLPCGVPMPAKLIPQTRPTELIRILYLGRVANEAKRVHLFPQIARKLEQERIAFHWTIAGDGPDRTALETEIKRRGLTSRFNFLGTVSYMKTGALFDNHDVLMLVSDYEGLPLSLLEAMGHGIVPVVSDLASGIREVVDQSNGILVPVDDIEGYARAIVHLHQNRTEWESKSAAARQRVRTEFSVESMTDRWLEFLPKQTGLTVEWPRGFLVRGPLTDRNQWWYSAPLRRLRRILKLISV